jgi:hypothetical protein
MYELKYEVYVYDQYNNLINSGYIELRVTTSNDLTSTGIINYAINIQGGRPLRSVMEKAITYPNISIFTINVTVVQHLLKDRWYNNSICAYRYVDTLPYSFPNGQIVKAIITECLARQGGNIYLKYDEKTGILLEKSLSFYTGGEVYLLQLQLVTPVDGMSFLNFDKEKIAIFQLVAFTIAIFSAITYFLRDKYRIM